MVACFSRWSNVEARQDCFVIHCICTYSIVRSAESILALLFNPFPVSPSCVTLFLYFELMFLENANQVKEKRSFNKKEAKCEKKKKVSFAFV